MHTLPLRLLEDHPTRAHELRVARLARAIARRMGLSNADVALIGRAARVHDIGKVAVPLSLLEKPSSLGAVSYTHLDVYKRQEYTYF